MIIMKKKKERKCKEKIIDDNNEEEEGKEMIIDDNNEGGGGEIKEEFKKIVFNKKLSDWDTINDYTNKHCLQVLLNDCYSKKIGEFTRILVHNEGEDKDAKAAPYRRRKHEEKTVIHWGQRKLLMSEIEFLSLKADDNTVVIYAGAAPGTHIKYLSGMFPTVTFYLVDPAPFTVKEDDKIKLFNCLFTDELATEWRTKLSEKGYTILFISDIRSADFDIQDNEEVEERVQADMEMQQNWHDLLEPLSSMLKFRLPYSSTDTTEYLSGDIYLPVWGPLTTSESRLITHPGKERKIYDNAIYESQMFYFNTITRPALYYHEISSNELDHCYDCRAEIHILSEYLKKYSINKSVDQLSTEISHNISIHRTLATGNVDPSRRRQVIRKNQWINGKPAYENYENFKYFNEDKNNNNNNYDNYNHNSSNRRRNNYDRYSSKRIIRSSNKYNDRYYSKQKYQNYDNNRYYNRNDRNDSYDPYDYRSKRNYGNGSRRRRIGEYRHRKTYEDYRKARSSKKSSNDNKNNNNND
eukprot:TRINITY_DN1300_c1_g1_i5.p1 TRINITY_DN1300_c1_g1~~TRINITY_DN1300_c1_g1_i5.p1  ORF type:complete len:524 (-),score=159.89 TRINITY_DN1300_c1_g1_i5:2-1573(-)